MAFNTSRKSIDRMRQRYAASWDVKDLPRSGRPRVTSRAEDRLITNTTLRIRFTDHADSTITRCWRHNRLFKPSGAESMQLGSSHTFLLRSPLFFQRHRAARLQFACNHVRWNKQNGELSCSQMRAGFVYAILTGDYVSGVEMGSVEQKSTRSHAMLIMEEASWSGWMWRRTGVPTSMLFQEYWPDNATSNVVMSCLAYDKLATMATSKMTTQDCIWQGLSTDICKLTMSGV